MQIRALHLPNGSMRKQERLRWRIVTVPAQYLPEVLLEVVSTFQLICTCLQSIFNKAIVTGNIQLAIF